MSRIHILDKSLASKIAAGEVVERPESVLKELLENSIDAGASMISVHIIEGGKRLIKVVDNGSGIAKEDAPLAFLRHATSKISTEDDLEHIMTMGFRGEALASISAVSRVTLRTRRPGEVAGTSVIIEGGAEPLISDDGCPEGTAIEIKDLFYNTPARLKFLRGAEAEYGRILEIFKKIALVNPERRFRISHGSGRTLDAMPGTLGQRIADLFGVDVKQLIEIATPDLKGFIGNHELTYPTPKYVHTYVNGRPVRDRSINRAILEGYGQLLDGGRYPFIVIDLIVPPEDVDVNIHPTKSEVRFKNTRYIDDLVKYGVRGVLTGFSTSPAGPASFERPQPFRSAVPQAKTPFLAEASEPYNSSLPVESPLFLQFEDIDDATKTPEFLRLSVIGQLWDEFLIAETPERDGNIYIIDQHGAAERCAFERLKEAFASGTVKSQALLLPERFETTPDEKEEVLNALPRLSEMGFEVVPFGPSIKSGGETFLVKSVPDILSGRASAHLIKDLAQETSHYGGSSKIDEKIESALMRIACHSVVRGAVTLSRDQGQALLKDLSRVDFAGHCPHGRPVVKRISRGELEAMFKR
jgi:DNA mismatch repair protein MutL